jgi:hypothetical protein
LTTGYLVYLCYTYQSATMAYKSQNEAEQDVKSWGFNTVFTWTDGP